MSQLGALLVFQAFITAVELCGEQNKLVTLSDDKNYRLEMPEGGAIFLHVHVIDEQDEWTVDVQSSDGKLSVRYSDSDWCLFLLPSSSSDSQKENIEKFSDEVSCTSYAWFEVQSSPEFIDMTFKWNILDELSFELNCEFIQHFESTPVTSSIFTMLTTSAPTESTSTTSTLTTVTTITEQRKTDTTTESLRNEKESCSDANAANSTLLISLLAIVSVLMVASWSVLGLWIIKNKKAQTQPDDEQANSQDDQAPEIILNEIYNMQPVDSPNVQRQNVGDAVYTVVARR